MGDALREFSRWRCRLQRLADAKIFSGWVRATDGLNVEIDLGARHSFVVGSQFHLELSGRYRTAMGRTQLTKASGHIVRVLFEDEPKFISTSNAARRQADGLHGMLEVKSDSINEEFDVVDISEHGIGILTNAPLEIRSMVELRLQTKSGLLLASGQVKYCRSHPGAFDLYRTGIEFIEGRGPNADIWNRFLDEPCENRFAA